MQCVRCGREFKGAFVRWRDGVVCQGCASELEAQPETCPVCGETVAPGDAVAVLLTRASATPEERRDAVSVLVHACGRCGVLHVDGFQNGLLAGLRNSAGKDG